MRKLMVLFFSFLFASIVWFSMATVAEGSQISALVRSGISYPITKTVRHLQPKLSWGEARIHAKIIWKEAERSTIDWKLILAIAHLESSLTKFKGDWACGFTSTHPNKYQCVHRSFGPMHVMYQYWRKPLKLDHKKLKYDLAYGYRIGVRILEIKGMQSRDIDPQWYAEFNAKSKEFKDNYSRLVRKRIARINRFLRKLKG